MSLPSCLQLAPLATSENLEMVFVTFPDFALYTCTLAPAVTAYFARAAAVELVMLDAGCGLASALASAASAAAADEDDVAAEADGTNAMLVTGAYSRTNVALRKRR